MPLKIYSKLLSLFLASASCLSWAPWAHAQVDSGTVELRGLTSEQAVYVDGIRRDGASRRLEMPAGLRWIVVPIHRSLDCQIRDFGAEIFVDAGRDTVVTVVEPRLLHLITQPFNAEVSDGLQVLGNTPLYCPVSELDGQVLILRKQGYENSTVQLTDSLRKRGTLFVNLRRIQDRRDPDVENIFWDRKAHHKHGNVLWVASAGAVLSGGVAAYFKIRADDRFELAKLARRDGDLVRQRRLEKETKRLDRVALAGFVSMQLNVLAVIYLLFRSR